MDERTKVMGTARILALAPLIPDLGLLKTHRAASIQNTWETRLPQTRFTPDSRAASDPFAPLKA